MFVFLQLTLYLIIEQHHSVCGNQLNISSPGVKSFASSHLLYQGSVKYTGNIFSGFPVCLLHLTLRSFSVGREAHLMRIVIDCKSCLPRSCPPTFFLTFKDAHQLTNTHASLMVQPKVKFQPSMKHFKC